MSAKQRPIQKLDAPAAGGAAADKKAISDTAIITLRAYETCGIPLVKEFLNSIGADKRNEKSWLAPEGNSTISPEQTLLLRARYLGGDAVVRQLIGSGRINTFIERAAGMYPFGFSITNSLPVTYIETDISDDFALKPELCAKVRKELGIVPKGNLLFTKMDAKTLDGIDAVSMMLRGRDGPICTLDAGLMIYQTEEGFASYVEAGKRLLMERQGSVWVATDMSFRTREFIEGVMAFGPEFKGYFDKIKEKLGVDHRDFFPNNEKQFEFLASRGLEVKCYGAADLGYGIWFDGLEKSTMPFTLLQSYVEYINRNFRTLVLQLRK
jgi:hypothetical protein